MGTSTDAILAFGVQLKDDAVREAADLDNMDAEDELAQKLYELRQESANGLEIIRHCRDAYPMYFLAISGTQRCASRGEPERIEALPVITEEQMDTLTRFIEEYCIQDKLKGPIGWWLFSDWS